MELPQYVLYVFDIKPYECETHQLRMSERCHNYLNLFQTTYVEKNCKNSANSFSHCVKAVTDIIKPQTTDSQSLILLLQICEH